MIFYFPWKKKQFAFYETVGDRICVQEKTNGSIAIYPNKKFTLLWGGAFILIGFYISLFLMNNGEGKLNAVTLTIILAPGIFFALIGLLYIYQVRDRRAWFFDPEKRTFSLSNKQEIPFSQISSFKLFSVPGNSTIHSDHDEIHELYLYSGQNKRMRLFQDESDDEIRQTGELLSQLVNVPFTITRL